MHCNDVEKLYRQKMAEMGGKLRVARVVSLFNGGRAIVASRILAENPGLTGLSLKIAVAKQMYRRDPNIQKLLDLVEHSHV